MPGLDFDRGLRRIESDKNVGVLLEHYKDSEVLTIYVEMRYESLMVVSPKGKILLQNSSTCKGPLNQLLAAEVASASKKHCEEDYGADVGMKLMMTKTSNMVIMMTLMFITILILRMIITSSMN